MPIRNILICDAGSDVKHDDTALSVDIISITETTELFLSSSIPDIELDVTQVLPEISVLHAVSHLWWITYCAETKRVDFDTKRSIIFLLEFSSQMTLDESGLQFLLAIDSDMLMRTRAVVGQQHRAWNSQQRCLSGGAQTFPVPPSPTSTSLKVGMLGAPSAILMMWCLVNSEVNRGRWDVKKLQRTC